MAPKRGPKGLGFCDVNGLSGDHSLSCSEDKSVLNHGLPQMSRLPKGWQHSYSSSLSWCSWLVQSLPFTRCGTFTNILMISNQVLYTLTHSDPIEALTICGVVQLLRYSVHRLTVDSAVSFILLQLAIIILDPILFLFHCLNQEKTANIVSLFWDCLWALSKINL